MLTLMTMITALAAGPDAPPADKILYDPELFKTLVNPDCSHCVDEARRAAGALRPDDRVLAWIRGEYNGGAIPYRWFLVPYRVISDSYGVFVYDPDADFVRGWPASYDFRFHGWRNGVMVMRDKDGTIYDTLTGLAVDGPRKGERLTPLATLETDWGPWLRAQPKTVAYQMVAKFQPMSLPSKESDQSLATRPDSDKRLDPGTRVFGLAVGGASTAWPLKNFGPSFSLESITLGQKRALVLWDGSTRTAVAFAPETDGSKPEPATLSLPPGERDPEAPWVDRETGSHWSIVGRAVSGPRKGEALKWLPGVMVKWFAWSAEYPETTIASQ
jgi:hypothetical protein